MRRLLASWVPGYRPSPYPAPTRVGKGMVITRAVVGVRAVRTTLLDQILPFVNLAVRSQRAASSASCVTITTAVPN